MFNKLKNKNIYLALPYSHNDPQVREARYRTATSVAAFLMSEGATVFSPITYGHQICQYGIDTSFKRWAELDYPMISWADEFWLLELDGYEISFGVQEELKQAMLVGTKIVRISQQDISNFLSHTSASPYDAVAASAPRVAEVRYQFIIKSKYKYGDTIFVIDDNNQISEQEVTEIAIAVLQNGGQSISYNGFHSKLVFSSKEEARKALETVFV